jgi:hypothetical protein
MDHNQAPDEHWTVAWMNILPNMEFALEIIRLDDIHPNEDLMSVEDFQRSLRERADEREESILRGISIEPLLIHRTPAQSMRDYSASLVNRNGFELMDGYTRYTVLKRQAQKEVYAYVGFV